MPRAREETAHWEVQNKKAVKCALIYYFEAKGKAHEYFVPFLLNVSGTEP